MLPPSNEIEQEEADDDEDDDTMDVDSEHDSSLDGPSPDGPSSQLNDDTPVLEREYPVMPSDFHHASMPLWLSPIEPTIAIWVETFLDECLRMPGLHELRCIHDIAPPGALSRDCRLVRYGQVCDGVGSDSDTGPHSTYMIRYLGVMEDGLEEDDALWWHPRELRRGGS